MSRNWSEYNDELVRRGEIYLEPGFLEYWDEELEKMNRGKHGRPFEFPESFIEFAATLYLFLHLPYRQLEGFINVLAQFLPGMESTDYTNLYRRARSLELEKPEPGKTEEGFVVALDSTGFKVTSRGEWLCEKHGKRRKGWIKAHVAVDAETGELLRKVVTDETVHDNEVFPELIQDLEIDDCLGDGAYDSHESFQLLDELKTGPGPPGIKTRKNSVVTGDTPRDRAVKERQELGYEKWREKHGYGRRWMVETFFSSVKRCFGETIRAKTPETAKKEVERKLQMYSTVAKMAKTT